MDKLGNQVRLRLQKHISVSIDHLNPQKYSEQKTKAVDYHLKWIAFSELPFSLLPVLLAHCTDSKPKRSASAADILSSELYSSLRPAEEFKMPASTYVDSTHIHSDPFKATFLWEKIVGHLERTVKTGRHNIGLRSYDNCFHGSKAVECLISYVNTILPKTVKREQVVVLCEKLMETGVIQSVKEKQEFREKGLFRFTFSHFWDPTPESSPLGSCDSDEMVSSLKDTHNGLPKSRSLEAINPESSESTPPSSSQADLRLPILKGYASDSTVTISSRSRKKRSKKAIKCGDTLTSRMRLNEISTLTRHIKLHTVTKLFTPKDPVFKVPTQPVRLRPAPKPAKLKPDVPTRSKSHKCTTSRHQPKENERPKRRYSHREFVQVREKENGHLKESVSTVAAGLHGQEAKKVRRSSRVKERDCSLQNSQNWQHLSELSVNMSHGTHAILNSTGMNRSHSFSSCGELMQSVQVSDSTVRHSGKWIVYGFI